MFASAITKAKERDAVLSRELVKKRRCARTALKNLTVSCMDTANAPVAKVYANQCYIEEELKMLNESASLLVVEADQWVKLYKDFNSHIKEMGEIRNWAREIRKDMEEIIASCPVGK